MTHSPTYKDAYLYLLQTSFPARSMKTKNTQRLEGLQPVVSEEKLFCRATSPEGDHFLEPLPVGYLLGLHQGHSSLPDGPHRLDERGFTLRVLTWNGQNFAWKKVLSAESLTLPTSTGFQLTIAGRTGFNRALLYGQNHVLVDKEVFDITSSLKDGIWRRASRLASGRSVSSVSGPELPTNPALLHKWEGGSIHRATAQVVKAKNRVLPGIPVGLTIEDSTNVVLANGLIVRTWFDASECVYL